MCERSQSPLRETSAGHVCEKDTLRRKKSCSHNTNAMIDTNRIITLIDLALLETDKLVEKSNFYKEENEPILSTKKVLFLLKREIEYSPDKINERLLRAMHDLGMSSYKDFENTPLEGAINNLTAALYNELSEYKHLTPLRRDFGKGNPV